MQPSLRFQGEEGESVRLSSRAARSELVLDNADEPVFAGVRTASYRNESESNG